MEFGLSDGENDDKHSSLVFMDICHIFAKQDDFLCRGTILQSIGEVGQVQVAMLVIRQMKVKG